MNDSAPGTKDKRVNIKSRSGKKIVFECVTNVCTLYVNMQYSNDYTSASKTTRAPKDYINYMSARKLHKHPKLHERKKAT